MSSSRPSIEVPFIQKGRYQHFKGNFYELVDVALHSETQEAYVVYKALYGGIDGEGGGLWIRPFDMFDESIERDGKTIKRFQYVGEE